MVTRAETKATSLPQEAQSEAELRERFGEALRRDWKVSECQRSADRPGLHRRHVLDFADGLRLIVSFDVFEDGEEARLHVSASMWPGELAERLRAKASLAEAVLLLLGEIGERVGRLARRVLILQFVGLVGCVPHLIGPTRSTYEATPPAAGQEEVRGN